MKLRVLAVFTAFLCMQIHAGELRMINNTNVFVFVDTEENGGRVSSPVMPKKIGLQRLREDPFHQNIGFQGVRCFLENKRVQATPSAQSASFNAQDDFELTIDEIGPETFEYTLRNLKYTKTKGIAT